MPERKDIAPADMTDEQLIEAVAVEVMRWHGMEPRVKDELCPGWRDRRWNPINDHNAIRKVEQQIGIRVLSEVYCRELMHQFDGMPGYWALVHGTNRERCIAALLAVRSSKQS